MFGQPSCYYVIQWDKYSDDPHWKRVSKKYKDVSQAIKKAKELHGKSINGQFKVMAIAEIIIEEID